MHKKHLKKSDPCNDKNIQQIRKEKKKNFFNLIKNICRKPTANVILNSENLLEALCWSPEDEGKDVLSHHSLLILY